MLRSIILTASLALATNAQAANYVVSTFADSGPGSLREAVGFANATPGVADTITFAVPGLITLTSGQLTVTDTLTITGAGANQMTINGNLNGRIFEVQGNTTNLTLVGMTLTGGLVNNHGGAIWNSTGGNLTLSFMRITQNQAGDTGGAIYDGFQPDVGGSSVNFLTISNSEFSINRAGKAAAVFHSGYELRIDNTTFYNNIANDSVGAIHEQGGFATIRNSTFSDNNAVTAVGGILSENSTTTLESTIVANNTDPTGINDINRIGSGVVNATNSLFEEDISASVPPVLQGGTDVANLIGVDPQLVAFGANGGPTNSMRPGPASPAIGTGSNSQAYAFDQRGKGFPRDAGGAVDIGAIQAYIAPPPRIAQPVPAVGGWQLGLLAMLLALGAAFARRRSSR